jgi:hypothetical protein
MRSSSSRRRYSSAVMCRPSCVITSMLEVSTPVWVPVPRLIMRRIRSRRAIAEETLEQLRLRFDAQAVYALELWIGESRRPYPMAVIRCGGALRPECRSTALLASRSHPGIYVDLAVESGLAPGCLGSRARFSPWPGPQGAFLRGTEAAALRQKETPAHRRRD